MALILLFAACVAYLTWAFKAISENESSDAYHNVNWTAVGVFVYVALIIGGITGFILLIRLIGSIGHGIIYLVCKRQQKQKDVHQTRENSEEKAIDPENPDPNPLKTRS